MSPPARGEQGRAPGGHLRKPATQPRRTQRRGGRRGETRRATLKTAQEAVQACASISIKEATDFEEAPQADIKAPRTVAEIYSKAPRTAAETDITQVPHPHLRKRKVWPKPEVPRKLSLDFVLLFLDEWLSGTRGIRGPRANTQYRGSCGQSDAISAQGLS